MTTTQPNGLGRRFAPDTRDNNYLMRRFLGDAGTASLPQARTWRINSEALNQGPTGSCVGHAWRNFLRCEPLRYEKSGPRAFDIYRAAVLIDPWPDNDTDANCPDMDSRMNGGTSVRAGAQVLASSGHLESYLWAFDLSTVVEWVLTRGPVVVGTNWYGSFDRPDANGLVTIAPDAYNMGGHAYLLRGVNMRRSLATFENSWGDKWGKSGGFSMPLADLERLLHEDGEACTAVERRPSR